MIDIAMSVAVGIHGLQQEWLGHDQPRLTSNHDSANYSPILIVYIKHDHFYFSLLITISSQEWSIRRTIDQ